MKISEDWLTERVDSAPTSYLREMDRAALRTRMAWQKLHSQAGAGDEVWAFANPADTGKRQGRVAGYALVREGKIIQSVTLD